MKYEKYAGCASLMKYEKYLNGYILEFSQSSLYHFTLFHLWKKNETLILFLFKPSCQAKPYNACILDSAGTISLAWSAYNLYIDIQISYNYIRIS